MQTSRAIRFLCCVFILSALSAAQPSYAGVHLFSGACKIVGFIGGAACKSVPVVLHTTLQTVSLAAGVASQANAAVVGVGEFATGQIAGSTAQRAITFAAQPEIKDVSGASNAVSTTSSVLCGTSSPVQLLRVPLDTGFHRFNCPRL